MLQRVSQLGAAAATPQDVATDAHAFETFARGVLKKISGLDAAARVLLAGGVPPSAFTPKPEFIDSLVRFGEAMRALDNGTASLQPYRFANDSTVRFAVLKTGSQLGWWPIAVKVVQVAAPYVLSAAGVYLADAWLDARKADSNANEIRATTEQSMAELAVQLKNKGDTAGALRLAETVTRASAAASAAPAGTSWLDTLKTAAAGAGGGLVLLALLWAFTQRRGKRGRA